MKKYLNVLKNGLLATCLLAATQATPIKAGQQDTNTTQHHDIFDNIWETPKLYSSSNNSIVQKVSLIGRYHGQYWWAKSENNKNSDWENRRIYVGFNAKVLNNFTIEVQANLNDNLDPPYKALYDLFIKWQPPNSHFSISTGRLDYVYTGMERSTSSKRIKTMERALLVGQIMPGEVIGIYINDTLGNFSYQTGLFSGSIKDEFTDFTGGFTTLLSMQYKLPLFYEKGSLHLDYLYNNGNKNNNAFKPYQNIVSLWHEGQKEAFAFGIDLTAATGIGAQSDVFGVTLLPTCDLAHNLLMGKDKLQLAIRYHYASSSDSYGLGFNKRYEQPVTSGKGDSYSSVYIGLNYFLYQQKLKVMAGLEYFEMNNVANEDDVDVNVTAKGVDGWTTYTGFRLYF